MTSLGIGFHLGSRRTTPPGKGDEREEGHRDEDEDEEAADGDLASVQADFNEPCKLVRFSMSTVSIPLHTEFSAFSGASSQDGLENDPRKNSCAVSFSSVP